jgi:signal transduction histidine kinase
LFGTARWRLTLWFTLAIGAILLVLAAAVFLSTRAVLFGEVNSDLQSRAGRERPQLLPRIRFGPGGEIRRDIVIGPTFTTGGYFYALVSPSGEVIASTPNADPSGLANEDALATALEEGDAFDDTESAEGDSLRVYVARLDTRGREDFLLQVGRSTEPERRALNQLLIVLAGGVGGGLVLSIMGGYWLSGRALRPIKSAMDSQRAFIADASHELRTPLSVVRANAELLKRHPTEPLSANGQALDDIIDESDRLGRLVGQMLTLAQVDSGQAPLTLSELPLDEVADEVARKMQLLAGQRGVDLRAEVEHPVRLKGDPDRLRELMVILTDNAIKYTDAGGQVKLEVRKAGSGKATVKVSDTGAGIPSEALPHIFDRFYRVDKARSREAGGTGLGLPIARWIAEAHGGSIRVESSPGVGSVFTVELPA